MGVGVRVCRGTYLMYFTVVCVEGGYGVYVLCVWRVGMGCMCCVCGGWVWGVCAVCVEGGYGVYVLCVQRGNH